MPLELDWLARWARDTPDAIAVTQADGPPIHWTYPWLYRASCRLAHFLRAQGVTRGSRLAVLAPSDAAWFPLFFATQRLGAMLVPLNSRLAARELDAVLADAEPACLVVHHDFAALPLSSPAPRLGFDALLAVLADEGAAHQHLPIEADFDDPCMVLYTSGTTGLPKGVLITHGMLFWNSVATGLRLDLTSRDATVSFLPFFHTSGWHVLNTPLFHRGARVVFVRKFEPGLVLETLERERISMLFGVPTTLDVLARHPRFAQTSFASVRFALAGGEPMPLELIRTYEARGVPVRQGFGMTEFGPNLFSLGAHESVRKMGSVGTPNPYVEVRLVDSAGHDVPPGTVGELYLRGPMATAGYWRNEAATRAAFHDGWFATGDAMRVDDEGFYFVAGRTKDMFISGGENVYPAEVERYLSSHPKVREVAVIGVPDATWGEVGKAFVAPMPGQTLTADEVLAFCRQGLAKYKTPKVVEVRDALPKGDSGKILKRSLK